MGESMRKLLVVERDEGYRRACGILFDELYEGRYEIYVVGSEEEMVKVMKREKVDVVLVDVDEFGYEMIDRVDEEVLVVVMSGKVRSIERVRDRVAGVVMKGGEFREMSEMIDGIVSRSRDH